LGAIQAVNDQGMKIPDDMSVIGFDNIPFSQTVYPTLTTMAQPIHEMADLVVELLIEKIKLQRQRSRVEEDKPSYKRIVLETKLIKRNSCREIWKK
jgi:LacI family transcriptional regulator